MYQRDSAESCMRDMYQEEFAEAEEYFASGHGNAPTTPPIPAKPKGMPDGNMNPVLAKKIPKSKTGIDKVNPVLAKKMPKSNPAPPGTYFKLLDQAGTGYLTPSDQEDTASGCFASGSMTAADHYEDWKQKSDKYKAMTADDRLHKAIDMKMEMELSVHEKKEPDFWLPDWADAPEGKSADALEGKSADALESPDTLGPDTSDEDLRPTKAMKQEKECDRPERTLSQSMYSL